MTHHAPNLMKLCSDCNKEKDGNSPSYCKSCKNKQAAEYRQNNKEKVKESNKKYYENNKEKILEQINKRNKEYYQSNKEKILEQKKEYHKDNPHKTREADRRRRALKKANVHEPYSEKQVLEKYGTNCHICKKPVNLSANRSAGAPGWQQGLHIDHVVPLSQGGPDTLNNVKPSHGLCNLQKNNKEKVAT